MLGYYQRVATISTCRIAFTAETPYCAWDANVAGTLDHASLVAPSRVCIQCAPLALTTASSTRYHVDTWCHDGPLDWCISASARC
ncbi:hypothetical protein COCCADRAFT_32270 [Bipolaris zeicola 26-R-13]|uniref:Uncharacterized protein n=1 Tax=Cochliobolus carbonum (strain 26-R-13) TaxID=930089 RepID=W6Z4I4_COCC2|nr:uncharacterized protein COCCADRAFT_32270 [Bipolaris zeicola 26-R-13]EUC38611.1 hypothetical protein COCCADRAFT_32270 [Bipolaris zeicola 26-R-13]